LSDPSPIEDISGWRWPGRLTDLCESWKRTTTDRERNRLLSEMWLLLNVGLTYYIRAHGKAYGHVDPEEARDIASEKAMVFLHRLESGSDPEGPTSPARICAYVSTLARNGLVDTLRKQGRKRDFAQKFENAIATRGSEAEANLLQDRFIQAICDCVSQLSEPARMVWFLRAFLDMPSKKISSHPSIKMSAAGVDMLLSRTRRALGSCMNQKGLNAEDAPTGTFVALWELLRGNMSEPKSNDDQ
jgi:DNA-directed RNA polymerase specialized sigma24 family protein